MKKEKIKVYIYTRVSTAMQIDGYSLDAQKSRMKAFADFNDYEIVGEYEDAGKSGKSIEGRIQFNQMMEDIKSGKDGVSYVLVFNCPGIPQKTAGFNGFTTYGLYRYNAPDLATFYDGKKDEWGDFGYGVSGTNYILYAVNRMKRPTETFMYADTMGVITDPTYGSTGISQFAPGWNNCPGNIAPVHNNRLNMGFFDGHVSSQGTADLKEKGFSVAVFHGGALQSL